MEQDFSVAIIAKNEEDSILAALASISDYGLDIVVVDTGSEDLTVYRAAKTGARVLEMGDTFTIFPESSDVETFGTRFGWVPGFRSDTPIFDHASARNFAASQAKHDWVLAVDADEVLDWNPDGLQALMRDPVLISFETLYGPNIKLTFPRMYNRGWYTYKGIIHEALVPNEPFAPIDTQVLTATDMRVVHHQVPKEHRTETYKVLEYLVATDYNARNLFYLGREYYNLGLLHKAIPVLRSYLEIASWTPEIAEARLLTARSLWGLGLGDEARTECLMAIGVNPEFKEALYFMAEMSWEREAAAWRRYASTATNDGVIFIRSTDDQQE